MFPQRKLIHVVFAFFSLFPLSSICGCAALRASGARQHYIDEQAQRHVYNKPIVAVWPEVRKVLFEAGYTSKSSDTGGVYSIETEPKPDDGGRTTKYLVQGSTVDDTSCRVEFTRMDISSSGARPSRDQHMEWALLKRVDPESAAQIQADAEKEANKARAN